MHCIALHCIVYPIFVKVFRFGPIVSLLSCGFAQVKELTEEYTRGLCSFIGEYAPKTTIPHRTDHVGVSTHS